MSESTRSAQTGGMTPAEDTDEQSDHPESEDTSDDGIKRVNITIHSSHHESLSKFAGDHGLSFSAFVRRGAQELKNRMEEDGTNRELQPILGELDKQQGTLADHGETLDKLVDQYQRLLTLVRHGQSGSARGDEPLEEVERRVETLLQAEEPLTIPELRQQTPYNRRQIQVALGQLQDEFVVRSTDPDDGPKQWRCR